MNPGENENSIKDSLQENRRDSATFLNNSQNGEARTKSNLIEVPSITLPKGGGAIKSIDEKFSVNAANGTASYSIPLPLSNGRKNFTPSLSLSYNSGGGNSIFGIGWSVDVPSIQRKTEKKLPEYKDEEESDVFLFSGAEDLVPELIKDEDGKWVQRSFSENGIKVTRYRPRIEGGFARIEKVEDDGNVYWRVRTKENIVSVFGESDEAKLVSPVPGEEIRTFKWNLEYTYDDKGNFARYFYKKENGNQVPASLFEKNRQSSLAPFTNSYLKAVKYGNIVPWYEGEELPDDFLFEVVLDYGEHDKDIPTPAEPIEWPARKDSYSDYKPGFEVRTYRLCRRILMFHHFEEELGIKDYLVRSLDFEYDEQPTLTYLEKVTSTGYIWNSDGTLRSKNALPPLEFTYFKPGFSREVKEISPDNIVHSPAGLDNQHYQWTDLYSEGIPGILSEQGDGWYFKENLGNGEFSRAKLVNPKPSIAGLAEGSLSIQELEANGTKYLVSTGGLLKGYFGMNEEEQWQSFRSFDSYPNIDLKDPNLKFLDLNGDGKPDLLFSNDQNFVWYASKGKEGYDDYRLAAKATDEEKGPVVFFADKDAKMLVATADMNGDGLSDIVVISYASVCYYPNLGYGKFGAKVNMQLEGILDSHDEFNPKYLHLADIDGTGTTDLVYIGKTRIQIWFNQSGNSLSPASEFFNPFPEVDDHSKLSVTDLLGNGTSCLVWSSRLPSQSHSPMRYVDIMGGRKPHVLVAHKNNMGKEAKLEYKSSTYYYLQDKKAGKKWITKLPFPVQCVSSVTVEDKVSRTRFSNEYSYHHGFYDSAEREFRGFAHVVRKDAEQFEHYVKETLSAGAVNSIEEDLFQPAVITKTWFHTGAYLNRDKWFHQLEDEYYPNALVKTGHITDPEVIATLEKYRLAEAPLPDELTTEEYIECCRSLKGLTLRQEVYSDEGSLDQQLHPYTVSQENYEVQMLQPRNHQRYAVFLTHTKEKLAFNYERNPLDPRIVHAINVAIDKYGNVEKSASIVYGRKKPDLLLPSDEDRANQTKQYITWAQTLFTEVIDSADAYRLPVSYEAEQWELNTAAPSDTFFSREEISKRFSDAVIRLYEEDTSTGQKRKLEHLRTLFLKNDLTGPMPVGKTDTLGLPYENYLLAFTPSLLETIYPGRWNESLLRNSAGYVISEGDSNYWIKSGRTYFHPDFSADPGATVVSPVAAGSVDFAKSNFYQALAFEDNFGNLSKVFYDTYKLTIIRTIDPVMNETNVDGFNYRTLSPYLLRDLNHNRAGVRFDSLGLVTHTFAMGKAGEFDGDLMDPASLELSVQDQPSSLLEYDFRYYTSNGALPNRVKSTIRENHYYNSIQPGDLPGGISAWLNALNDGSLNSGPARIEALVKSQVAYSYSDGSGKEVLKKIQAEPGLAPQRDTEGKLMLDSLGKIQQLSTAPALRWIGNGRTIYNNKGNAVKQYEPFFDSSPEYNTEEELTLLGVTAVLYYDALSRLIKTVHPNRAISRVEFDAWMRRDYDQNDTVLDSEWYSTRISGSLGADEQASAQQTFLHANTPMVTFLDSLGRPFIAKAHNKTQRSGEAVQEEFYYSRTELDIEGNARRIWDARGNLVMSWKYDMLGNICFQHSMDGGDRWMLADVMGKPLRLWDSRSQTFSYEYDKLHRPLSLLVDTGAGAKAFEKYEYGEGISGALIRNLKGKLYRQYDTAGVIIQEAYDFKGNLFVHSRQLHRDYKILPDWNSAPVLESEVFRSGTSYDALNRPKQMIAPDSSVFIPQFNEANLLNKVDIKIKGAVETSNFVSNIDYNAKAQREQIYYNNNTTTRYTYDPETYRLTRLLTTADDGSRILQDLNYTYDPIGNITSLFDNAQKTVFYGGQKVEAHSQSLYDAVYRLIESAGREHIGQVGTNVQDNWNDNWSRLSLHPNSPMQLRNYSQKYFYDSVGNLERMQHIAGAGSWTRNYQYKPGNNHLTETTVTGQTYTYSYNNHGSMRIVPQLQDEIDWNFREEMQHVSLAGGGEAWYVYDCKGQRIRKVIERLGNIREERIYLGPFELYRERTNSGISLERETLHVMDDKQRIAMVESRTIGNDGSAQQLIRYQYSNHIGTASLELDHDAKIISYEEFHPFGTTAYQATDGSRQVPAKRYRYTGMERDEETGMNYHTARYYMSWIGRWTAADPIGIGDGLNIYAYVKNNPIRSSDPSGNGDGVGPVQITNPTASQPSPQFPTEGVPSPHADGHDRALPPPGQGADVRADIALPDLHLEGRTRFGLTLGQPLGADPTRRGLSLTGDFTLRYPGIPAAVPIDPRIEGEITAQGTTTSDAAGTTLADPSRAIAGFTGSYTLSGELRGAPGLVGSLRLQGDAGGDRPNELRFDARVGLIADFPLLPFVSFTGTGFAEGGSVNLSGTFHGWGPGITWGNWDYSRSGGLNISGNYVGVQFSTFGLGSLDPRPEVPASPDDPAPHPDARPDSSLGNSGIVETFDPGTSVGYTRFSVNPHTGRYLGVSVGFAWSPTVVANDMARPDISLFSLPGGSLLQDALNYHPSVGEGRPAGYYGGFNIFGNF